MTNEPKPFKSTSGKLRGHDFSVEDDRIATNPRAMNQKTICSQQAAQTKAFAASASVSDL